jgi:hypothetical protein
MDRDKAKMAKKSDSGRFLERFGCFWPLQGQTCQLAGGGGEGPLNVLNLLEGSLEHAWRPCRQEAADFEGFASAASPLWKLSGSGDPRTSGSEVVAILGCLGAILGHVGLSWGHLRPCWAVLGLCWGHLGLY